MTNLSIKKWSPGDRPRERFMEKGPRALSDAELVAILIRTGTREEDALAVARNLLDAIGGSVALLSRSSWPEMAKIKGIGAVKAVTLSAAFELGRRSCLPVSKSGAIRSASDIAAFMIPLLRDLRHEECWVLYLDGGRKIIGKEQISSGGLNATVVDTRMVLKLALEKLACEMVLVHNHPSGQVIPGKQDRLLTRLLKAAAEAIDVKLIDHLVIGAGKYYSFAEEGLL